MMARPTPSRATLGVTTAPPLAATAGPIVCPRRPRSVDEAIDRGLTIVSDPLFHPAAPSRDGRDPSVMALRSSSCAGACSRRSGP